jgi:hypothetical protein
MARAFTHVLMYDGGAMVEQLGPLPERDFFAAVLQQRDGKERWGLVLSPIPESTTYEDMLDAGEDFDEYLQVGGSADALTVEISKTDGAQWGCDRVRYVVGHPHDPGLPLDVEIPMPGELKVSAAEVFDADEAADLFDAYHQTGDLPPGYSLRPAQGYRADGTVVDIAEPAPLPRGLDEFLVSTHDNVTLVSVGELTEDEKAAVPPWFLEVLGDGPAGVVAATNHWQSVVPGALDDAIALFRDRAVGIWLGRESQEWGGDFVLVYVLRGGDDDPYICWYGYPPSDSLENPTGAGMRPGVKADLTQVSAEFRAFYTQVHNRFRLAGYGECGLPPLEELFTLDGGSSDYEYLGDSDHHPEPQRLLPVFLSSNGNLCVELGTENAWTQDDSIIRPQGQIWPGLNAWIRRFTEELL